MNNLQKSKQDIITCISPPWKDVQNNTTIDLSAYGLNNAFNASNVTTCTLPVSFDGIGTTTLNNKQMLIGNGTNALFQSPNLIWDDSSNGLGTQLLNPNTSFQVNNDKRLWIVRIDSTPNSSISVLNTDKY